MPPNANLYRWNSPVVTNVEKLYKWIKELPTYMKPQYCDVLSLETITLHDFDVKLHSTIGFSDSF